MPVDSDRVQSSRSRCDIVFVCQAGELEQQSILLAQSIRLFGGALATARLHAIVPLPEAVYGSLRPSTLDFLGSLGVDFHYRTNPISDSYKTANKLNAFDIDAESDTIVFLDTDVLVLNDFSDVLDRRCVDVLAMPALRLWPSALFQGYSEELWEGLYADFGLTMPRRRIVSPETGRHMLPYFNAGVVVCSARAGLSELWIRVARQLNRLTLPRKYPYLDQIALPIALTLGNLSWDALPEECNFRPGLWVFKKKLRWVFGGIDWFNRPATLSEVRIMHYHAYRVLEKASNEDAELHDKLQELLQDLPFKRETIAVPARRSLARRMSFRWECYRAARGSRDVARRPSLR
jgi:hypothetical protein